MTDKSSVATMAGHWRGMQSMAIFTPSRAVDAPAFGATAHGRTYELVDADERLGWCITHDGTFESEYRNWRTGQHWFFRERRWPSAFTLRLYQANGVPPPSLFPDHVDLSARYASNPLTPLDAETAVTARYVIRSGATLRGLLAFGAQAKTWFVDPVQTTIINDRRYLDVPAAGLRFETSGGEGFSVPAGWYHTREPSLA